jgi:hypothetical protein
MEVITFLELLGLGILISLLVWGTLSLWDNL